MSSEVQAKWVYSANAGQGASRSLRKYSTALTSWFVVRSISLTARASASEKPLTVASRRRERVRLRLRPEAGLRGEPGEPRGLDADPRPDEGEFAEPRAKLRGLARVASVERREGGERRELHQPAPRTPVTVTPQAAE